MRPYRRPSIPKSPTDPCTLFKMSLLYFHIGEPCKKPNEIKFRDKWSQRSFIEGYLSLYYSYHLSELSNLLTFLKPRKTSIIPKNKNFITVNLLLNFISSKIGQTHFLNFFRLHITRLKKKEFIFDVTHDFLCTIERQN